MRAYVFLLDRVYTRGIYVRVYNIIVHSGVSGRMRCAYYLRRTRCTDRQDCLDAAAVADGARRGKNWFTVQRPIDPVEDVPRDACVPDRPPCHPPPTHPPTDPVTAIPRPRLFSATAAAAAAAAAVPLSPACDRIVLWPPRWCGGGVEMLVTLTGKLLCVYCPAGCN